MQTKTEAAADRLRRALGYLEQRERELAPCTCGSKTDDHAIACPAFARVDVTALRNDLKTLERATDRLHKIDEGLHALGILGVLS